MYTVLILKFWREVVIALLVIALVITAALYVNRGNTIDRVSTQYDLQIAVERAEFEAQARLIEQQNYKGVIDAINAANTREQAIRVDIVNANAANERLHDTIDRIQANTATSAADRAEYTTSVTNLFKQCTNSITELAAIADGHANDVKLLQDARRK